MRKKLLFVFFVFNLTICFSQNQHPKFKEYLLKSPNEITTFCVKKSDRLIGFLKSENINIKFKTDNWLFITTTPAWINENQNNGMISQFYFDNSPPISLMDSVRLSRFVDPVHAGTNGLSHSYTGEGVVMGYVDEAIDFRHPDFKDAEGKTRIMRIWDQTVNTAGHIFSHYGYGRLWDSTSINNLTCTQLSPQDHGTNCAGIGSGNGLANGKNKGIAPDSKIVMVSTNINAANWVLTVADACDYIFKYADSLGLPAVINISMGASYWGSHDANDPGSVMMEKLLDEKPGRIIVAAAGNSGAKGKYHVRGNVNSDTTFVWFDNDNINPKTNVNRNTIEFDLWADTSDSHFDFAFGADTPSPSYKFRGRTKFRNTYSSLNTLILDTIWNGTNRIATIQMWIELVDSAFHLQVYFDKIDSTNYKYRFMTKGSGSYDLWSGTFVNANTIVSNIPSVEVMPSIVNYQMPDSFQTIVSSFQCSEKVITVGNIRNRSQYINNKGVLSNMTPNSPGNISPNSSSGPTRLGVQKPDISAEGDGILTAWTLAHLTDNSMMALGGWHARVMGTSSSSPVVAGIAALYLQKCPKATYLDFKKDLIATATTNSFTGTTPNYKYGYGQPHVLNLLLGAKNIPIVGTSSICLDPVDLIVKDSHFNLDSIVWSNGSKGELIKASSSGDYSSKIYFGNGCVAYSDTFTIKQNHILPKPIITDNFGVVSSDLQPNYQWFLNGLLLPGETQQLLFISPPYGLYSLNSVSKDGCVSKSNIISISVGLDENFLNYESIFPNPTKSDFKISSVDNILSVIATDLNGKEIKLIENSNGSYSLINLNSGTYFLKVETEKGLFRSKIIKM
jgi:hypothetical protein